MKYRILIWAGVGFLVAACWALYAFPMMTSTDRLMPLIRLTCPVALLNSHPISLFEVLLANSATYALIGLAVEVLRQRVKHAH
jgi:hypothetical protein